MNKFGYTRESNSGFLETLDDLSFSLKEQGFGIINTIDVQSRINEKLGKNIDEYRVLGACNPSLAYDALDIEYEIGLFFPCNLIVYKKNNKVFVSVILPTVVMRVVDNEKIQQFAIILEEKLKKAIDNI